MNTALIVLSFLLAVWVISLVYRMQKLKRSYAESDEENKSLTEELRDVRADLKSISAETVKLTRENMELKNQTSEVTIYDDHLGIPAIVPQDESVAWRWAFCFLKFQDPVNDTTEPLYVPIVLTMSELEKSMDKALRNHKFWPEKYNQESFIAKCVEDVDRVRGEIVGPNR